MFKKLMDLLYAVVLAIKFTVDFMKCFMAEVGGVATMEQIALEWPSSGSTQMDPVPAHVKKKMVIV